MNPKEKSLTPQETRLGNFVLPNKAKVEKSLQEFQTGVKTREEVDGIVDCFFERMRRLNGVK